jgi:hypothetical protein
VVLDFDAPLAAQPPLGLHEELSHPVALRCMCGPAHLRLVALADGVLSDAGGNLAR